MTQKRLEAKVAVVTGAARGIGKAIGLRCIREGAAVAFADVNADQAEQAAQEGRKEGGRAIAVAVDVADRAQVRAMVGTVVKELGRLDILFNNAGVNHQERFLEATEQNWERIMRINGLGVLICTQEAAKQMIEQGQGGKIVNTASLAGRQGYPDIAPYCASKFAVVALTQAAARALAEHKIQVNAFSPGVVHTPLWDQLDQECIDMGVTKQKGEAMQGFAASALAGRVSTPDDLTGLAAFLASSEADYMTGQTIGIDGGMYIF